MADGPPTAYDVVPYLSGVRSATHPDNLAVAGRVAGLPTAPPDRCRVLEIGCGDGGNLIPMAVSLPGSQFVGVDLAVTAIERGRADIAAVGVPNVTLLHRDLADVGGELGMFDYVIAHGVYSWVPEPVRERLLQVARERMNAAGVAFVSYNAMPGTHVRHVLRGMMLRHTAGFTDPAKKVEQARALLELLAMAEGDAADVYRPILKSEVGRALMASDYLLYHDDLAPVSEPFFFGDVVDAARRHGLQFASEANVYEMSLEGLSDGIRQVLSELGQKDIELKEQYLDYVKCRSFRQTLFCHQEAELPRKLDVETIRTFCFSCEAKRDPDRAPDDPPGWVHPNRSILRTDNAVAANALDDLGLRFPQSVPFPELAARAGAHTLADEETLAEILFRGFSAGLVEMHLYEPPAVFVASDRPVASPWARHRAANGRVVNLYHDTLLVDEPARPLLALLDGTRTIPQLAAAMDWDEAKTVAEILDFARHGLLIG